MASGNKDRALTPYKISAGGEGNFFTGSFDTTNNLKNIDPFLTGYAKIIWLKTPTFLDQIFGTDIVKHFTEKNFKELSGLSDMELQTAAVTEGYGANELHFAGGIQKGNTEFTLKHQEFSGTPISKIYNTWVSMIRDPETNIAQYPRLFNTDYTAANHTAQLLYVHTRPDANNYDKDIIEFAALWTNVMPKRIPMGHFNYAQGSNDQVEIEIPFSGDFHTGPDVVNLAYKELKNTYAFETLDSYKYEGSKGDSETILKNWDNFAKGYYLTKSKIIGDKHPDIHTVSGGGSK